MKYFADILKQFSPKARMTALILLLLTLIIMLSIKAFTTKSDCSIQQKQIDDCIKSQAVIMQTNHDIIERDRKLVLQLDSMIGRIKPDTIVIVQTITSQQIQTESHALAKHNSNLESSEGFMATEVASAAPEIHTTSKKEETKIKKGNTKQILQGMKNLMKN